MVARRTSDEWLDTSPTRVAVIGSGWSYSALERIKQYIHKHGGSVVVVDHKPSLATLRRSGKSEIISRIVVELAFHQYAVYEPKHLHDYPMLIRYFHGAIVRRMRLKDRPAVVHKQPSHKDRLINKRKTFIKSWSL